MRHVMVSLMTDDEIRVECFENNKSLSKVGFGTWELMHQAVGEFLTAEETNQTASNEYQDVLDFNRKYELPISDRPIWASPELMDFRIKFLQEELNETIAAYYKRDMAEFFDGLIDLAYVVFGTAIVCGLPWKSGWREVHRANMKKVRTRRLEDSVRKSQYDVTKPVGWQPPNIRAVLEDYGWKG